MKKSIFALMTMVSLGAAGLESGQAHASELPSHQHNQPYQYNMQQNQNKQQPQQQNGMTSTTNNNTSNTTTTTSSDSSSSSSASSSDSDSSESTSSVYKRFIAAGGTEELWEKVVLPESGGDPNASNGQYHGLGQTNQSWGYGSVETQTKGMISYAKERYGSIEAAISFRESNGWW